MSTINFNVNNLGITENLIIYDLLSNDCQTISLNLNKRVSSFVIIDNYVYYSTIHYEEGMIKWELYRDSMNFDSPTLLLNGFFNLPFDYPVLIKKLDKIYFISTDDKSKMQNVYEITIY